MPPFLHDSLLSFCPAAVRKIFRPESPHQTLRAATWLGLAQFLLLAYVTLLRFLEFFAMRARQLAPHLAGASGKVQSGAAIIIALEFLIHPTSILLLYLTFEGIVRFAAGLVAEEVVPSLPVVVVFWIFTAVRRKGEDRRNRQLPPDAVEVLPGHRLRIASARHKPRWNASITISIGGEWYEVEGEETGSGQHPFVYILRCTPPSKILRGYEEYDVASAEETGGANRSSSAERF
jgi:hypothetical protein